MILVEPLAPGVGEVAGDVAVEFEDEIFSFEAVLLSTVLPSRRSIRVVEAYVGLEVCELASGFDVGRVCRRNQRA